MLFIVIDQILNFFFGGLEDNFLLVFVFLHGLSVEYHLDCLDEDLWVIANLGEGYSQF